MSDDRQETLADIVAEMRDEAARADMEQYYTLDDAAESMREFAERLDKALKRERAAFDCECAGIAELAAKEEAARHKPGNAAALREAVVALLDAMYSLGCDEDTAALAAFVPGMEDSSAKCLAAFRKAKAALYAPPRQCDVGTADEQDARFSRFCVEKRSGSCSGCPDAVGGFTVANGIRECALVWAQTPYADERKGEEDGK